MQNVAMSITVRFVVTSIELLLVFEHLDPKARHLWSMVYPLQEKSHSTQGAIFLSPRELAANPVLALFLNPGPRVQRSMSRSPPTSKFRNTSETDPIMPLRNPANGLVSKLGTPPKKKRR